MGISKRNLAGSTGNLDNVKQVSSDQSSYIEDRKDPVQIQIPGSFFPHANWFQNALWFKLTARELKSQSTAGRGGTIQLGRKGTTFKFLAPSQIVDTHQHNWEEYSSIQSRLLQYVISANIAWEQGGQVLENLKNQVIQAYKRGKWPSGEDIMAALKQVGNVELPRLKQDTPLHYTNSPRRTYQFVFTLADAEGGETITRAVELLQKYAAPSSLSDIDIGLPYIFKVETTPFSIIKMDYAALESVLATWMEPYIKGRPSRCELTLGFKDMSPLFRNTIERGGIVNVTSDTYLEDQNRLEVQRLKSAVERYQKENSDIRNLNK